MDEIPACRYWDVAVVTARSMVDAAITGKGGDDNEHFKDLTSQLLAVLLFYGANYGYSTRWMVTWAGKVASNVEALVGEIVDRLEADGHVISASQLEGVMYGQPRERGAVFTTLQRVLGGYQMSSALASTDDPNFDPLTFVAGNPDYESPGSTEDGQLVGEFDTVYITADPTAQKVLAPPIVGFLAQLRLAAYRHHRHAERYGLPVPRPATFVIDELATMAPLPDIGETATFGGEGLLLHAIIQDPNQARARFGADTAASFNTLFQNILIVPGTRDRATLELIEELGGKYMRSIWTESSSTDHEGKRSVSRAETFIEDNRLPKAVVSEGHQQHPDFSLLLRSGGGWEWIYVTPYYRAEPFPSLLVKAMQQLATDPEAPERIHIPLPKLDKAGDGRFLEPLGLRHDYYVALDALEKRGARITARPHGALLPLNSQPNFTVPEGA